MDPAEVIGPPRSLIECAERFLTQVEHEGPNLSPRETIVLFVSVARLRLTDWESVEILWTPERRRKVHVASRELYLRFQAQMELHRTALLGPLEAGIRELIEHSGISLERHQEIRRTHSEPWDANTSYEFLSEVIFPVDEIGYILELLRDLRTELREGTAALVRQLDRTLECRFLILRRSIAEAATPLTPLGPNSSQIPSGGDGFRVRNQLSEATGFVYREIRLP